MLEEIKIGEIVRIHQGMSSLHTFKVLEFSMSIDTRIKYENIQFFIFVHDFLAQYPV